MTAKTDGISAFDIDYIQSWNWRYLSSNCCPEELFINPLYKIENKAEYNPSAFWKHFRGLRHYGPCAWSNIDKIHVLGKKSSLSQQDRVSFHYKSTIHLAGESKTVR